MEQLLSELLQTLEDLLDQDTDCSVPEVRDAICESVWCLFIRPESDYTLVEDFGLGRKEDNQKARNAISKFVDGAQSCAQELDLSTFHDRLEACQNRRARTSSGKDYRDFFGWIDPDLFDEDGSPRKIAAGKSLAMKAVSSRLQSSKRTLES